MNRFEKGRLKRPKRREVTGTPPHSLRGASLRFGLFVSLLSLRGYGRRRRAATTSSASATTQGATRMPASQPSSARRRLRRNGFEETEAQRGSRALPNGAPSDRAAASLKRPKRSEAAGQLTLSGGASLRFGLFSCFFHFAAMQESTPGIREDPRRDADGRIT